jgi:integrase
MTNTFIKLLTKLTTPEVLKKITTETDGTKKHSSEFALKIIKDKMAKHSWDFIAKFFNSLVRTDTLKPDEILAVYPLLDKYTKAHYSKINTLARKFTILREAIKSKHEGELVIQSDRLMGIGQEESKKRNTAIKTKSEDKAKNRGLADQYDLKDVHDAIDTCVRESDYAYKAALVCLCVGSRLIEVLKTSKYELSPTDGNIIVSGLAKARNNIDKEPIDKPVLRVKSQVILDAVKTVRDAIGDDIKDLTNEQIASKLDAYVNRRVRKLFVIDTKAHTLRYIYANVAFQIYGIPLKIPETFYVQRVLGHEDATTSLTYQKIWVKIENIAKIPQDIKVKLNEVANDNELIRDEIKEMKEDVAEMKQEPPSRTLKRNKTSIPDMVKIIQQRVIDGEDIRIRTLKSLRFGTGTVMEALKIYKDGLRNPVVVVEEKKEKDEPVVVVNKVKSKRAAKDKQGKRRSTRKKA